MEMQVQTGHGLIATFKTGALDPVTGLHVLPDLNCLVVVHFKHSKVWLYSEQSEVEPQSYKGGEVLSSFCLPKLNNPSGMAGFTTQANTVIVSDFDSRNLHVIMLERLDGGKPALANHGIWKLHFRPADVSSVKGLFAVLNMMDSTIHLLGEDGTYKNKIIVHDHYVDKLYSVIGTPSHLLVVNCSNSIGGVHWVKGSGRIFQSYGGNKGDKKVMSSMHALQDNNDRVIIADHNNHRIQLVSKDGKFQKFLLQQADGMYLPRRMYLCNSYGKTRLIVGYGHIFSIMIRIYDYEDLCSGRAMASIFEDEDEVQSAAEPEGKGIIDRLFMDEDEAQSAAETDVKKIGKPLQ